MISIIIPCYNEEKNIYYLLKKIEKLKIKDSEVIVVDNKSEDRTPEVAKKFNVKVVFEKKVGKGNAIRKGVKESVGDILVFIDGDNSYSPEFIPSLINKIQSGKADIVYGSRFLKESKTKINFLRLIGNKFFSFLGFLFYQKKTDFLTGLFAIKKEKIFEINPKSRGFEIETEIFSKAVKKNLKIEHIPINYKNNKKSELNPFIDGFKIVFTLIKNKLC